MRKNLTLMRSELWSVKWTHKLGGSTGLSCLQFLLL